MQTLRLFISSPSDVRNERQIAGKVIARLQGKYWSFVRLEDVFWERSVARATAHFQDELRNPGECDIVIGILWSRLGSPLPERFRGLRGEVHATGTEWELAQAFEAYEKSLQETGNPDLAKPDVIVFRRTDQPASGADGEEASCRQRDALDAYLRREFHHDDIHGTIRRSLAHYQGLEEFEKRLHDDLEALILKRLPSLAPGFEPPPISGNPFMGLSVFGYDEADRFFGRTRAIREVRQRLCERAEAGTAFVLIYGASGHGKSSLMRAGVAPAVTRPGGALEGMDRWRRVLLQPGVGSGGLCERLARAILATAPEEEFERTRLNDLYVLSGFPELTVHGIPDPAAGGLTWDVAAFARYLAQSEDQVFAFAGIHEALEKEGLNLLLQIDQLEEVFAEGLGTEDRASFFRSLHGLSRGGRVWVLATLRSEFFPRIAGENEFRDLVGRDGGYILPPPDLQSWNEIVRYPALAARLDYEQQVAFREIGGVPTTEEWLHEQILSDIGGNPDVLPQLEFCLQRLYLDLIDLENPKGSRRGSRLTWESYAAMGGLRGAIATAADDAYKGLTPSERGARDYLFGNLVRVDDTVTRRRADLEALAKRPGAAAFIAAFREAKLLVADEDEGRAVVTLAHESLLTHWPVLAEWIEEHRSDLAAHQRLIRQAQLWEQNGRSPKYLLSAGHLAEAERVAESPLFLLSEPERELLRRSRAAARKRLRFLQAAVAVFALLATTAGVMGWVAEERRKETQAEKERTQVQLEKAWLEEGRAWLERAKVAWEGEKDPVSALMLAGRAVGFHGFGRSAKGGSTVDERYPSILGLPMSDPKNEERRQASVQAIRDYVSTIRPTGLPIWSTLFRTHHLGPVTCVAFSPDGKLIASSESIHHEVKLWDAATGRELRTLKGHSSFVSSVAFSPDGKQIVSGSDDLTVKLWNLETGKEMLSFAEHSQSVTCVAFSQDGRRIASGSKDDTLKIWDALTGSKIANLTGSSQGVSCIAFNQKGTQIASGDRDVIRLWDVASGVELANFQGHSKKVTSVAFSPDGKYLVSGGESVKMWDIEVKKELKSLLGHSSSVTCVAYSPDGLRFASASRDHTVKIWDAQTKTEIATLKGHLSEVASLAFSPDGTKIVSGSHDNMVKLWNLENGKELGLNEGHYGKITCMDMSPNGSRIATGGEDQTVRIWNASTGEELLTMAGHTGQVSSVAFSPDGSQVVSGSVDQTIKLWDAASGKNAATLMGHGERVLTVKFSPDGRRIASGAFDGHIKIWDSKTGRELATFGGDDGYVNSVDFSPDGVWMASGASNAVTVWNAKTGRKEATLEGYSGAANCVAFSVDGNQIASAFDHGRLKIWHVGNWEGVVTLQGHDGSVLSVDFSPDGRTVVSAGEDGAVRFWDSASGKELALLKGHSDKITSVAFCPDGGHITSVSHDGTMKLWDAAMDSEWLTIKGLSINVASVAFSPDGSRIASVSNDDTIKLWDTATGKESGSFVGQSENVTSVAFSPDGGLIGSGSDDATVKLWNVFTGEVVGLKGHTDSVTGVAFSPDGLQIVSGSDDQTVRLWSVATGELLGSFRGHSDGVNSVAFNPNGSLIASGSDDATVILWDGATGKEVSRLKGHSDGISSVAFSPDGSRIATGSWDNTVRLWDPTTGDETATLAGHYLDVNAVAFSPRGDLIASGSEDEMVKIWDASTGKEVYSIDVLVTSNLAFSPDGTLLAAGGIDEELKLWEVSHEFADIVVYEDSGYFEFLDQFVTWKASDSLLGRKLPIIHRRRDLLAQLAKSNTSPIRSLILQFELSAKTGKWRTLPTLLMEARNLGLESEPEVRRAFARVLANFVDELSRTESSTFPPQLWELVPLVLSQDCFEDTSISQSMARAITALINRGSVEPDLMNSILQAVSLAAPQKWFETVAQSIEEIKGSRPFSLNNDAKAFVTIGIRRFPDSDRLLRAGVVIHQVGDPFRSVLEGRLLALDGATSEDFIAAAYAAATRGDDDRARALLDQAGTRFADGGSVSLKAGFTYLILNDPVAARKAFEVARGNLEPGEKPGEDLFAGLAIGRWQTGDREAAVTHYRALIETGREQDEPMDWANPEAISDMGMPDAMSKALEEIRQATLAKHPELAPVPKPDPKGSNR